MSTKTQAKPLFAATLTPRRALPPAGRRVVIGLALALAVVPALLYTTLGGAAAATFVLADLATGAIVLGLALRASRTHEELTLWPAALELRRVDARGAEEMLRFSTATVRFVIDRDYNERVTALWLKEDTRRIPFGAFLSSDEMLSLAKVFGTALRKARG